MTVEDLDAALHHPHDLQAEKAVLKAMLRSADAIADIVDVLDGHDFYRPAHDLLYTTILDLYGRSQPTDPTAVISHLREQNRLEEAGGAAYITALLNGASPSRKWITEAERVQNAAMLRRMKSAAAHIENLASEAEPDAAERIADAAQAEIFAATTRRPLLPPASPLSDVMEDTLDWIEAVGSPQTSSLPGVPTGFTELDLLTGGLHPGQLIVVAARPAMGKSTLAYDFLRAASIKHSMPSALFTLEADRHEVGMRILSAEARVALHHMRSGTCTDEDWTRMARRIPDVTAAPIYIQDGSYANLHDLRAHCRYLHARMGVQLIVVDAVHLLTYGTRQLSSRYEEISEIARCLKLLAKELQLPIVAISTLNRGPEQRTDKKPLISDLRDSGALEDNADVVILIHREDAYEKDSPRAGEADLIVAKHRHGPTATITVAFQGHYSRFVDMAQT
ncbi:MULTISPECIES: replicative DNA helicase [Streptomyces]|uniref:replicative DNA helicase n=1 Tax=Streptomyces TaxID=1883 RepID=UPI001675F646|nr:MULTISPECIES: replicative DNA helicase [Streptomyces]MBK3521991.1 replicative DNA helicase [Streptomyces sp. MBT70]GGS09387.1 replicative DNA helicase [Streptomyces eurythermus]